MRQYEISQKAEEDIIRIAQYGIQEYGAEKAYEYHAGMEQRFSEIAQKPRLYRERTEWRRPVRSAMYGVHIIIFQLRDDGSIFIIRVRHQRENWMFDPDIN